MTKSKFSLLFSMIFIFSAFGKLAAAGEPTEAIRGAVNRGLKNAKLDNPKQRAQAIDRLKQIVHPLFDFSEMSKRALGSNWRRLTPQQQKEFVPTFTALLEKTYAGYIDLYHGQQVVYNGETIDGNYAEVDSQILDKNGKSYSVVYRLHKVDGKWKIYDVVAENISLVNNYRSQFNSVIAKSSVEELLKMVKEKAA
jgi:phospholipid transport system substrate-binding protein